MRLLTCLSLVLLMTAATFAQDSRTIKTDTIDGLICTNFADWKFMVRATEFWTPTKDDVLAAENQIEAYLKKDSKFHTSNLWRKLPEYKRQYVGIVVNGHKRIFCNFFCWSHRSLDDKPVFVFDGGECFFRIQYDLDDKQCYDFNANGYA
jgi:hypothetical protein